MARPLRLPMAANGGNAASMELTHSREARTLNLSSTMETSACAICGNQRDNRIHVAREMMFGYRDEFRYLECKACRCVQLIDVPSDMSRYYPKNYYSFAPSLGPKAFLNRQRTACVLGRRSLFGWLALQLLGPYYAMTSIHRARIALSARVLDVGCGAGDLIRDMKQYGYQHVVGIDPYIPNDIVHVDGVVVYKRSLEQMTGEFDVIMLNHSFEHLSDQSGALREMRRLLSLEGRILIRIPIADSFAWRRYGVNWMHLDAPRHLFLHSVASMRLLADQCGWRVNGLIYEGNASQFIGSEQYERNISLTDRRSVYAGGLRRWIGWWRARRLTPRADELNRAAQGDWACFELAPLASPVTA
jgi:SAM-dependent methyltransferase